MIFITGGSGFIGSNFVLDWLAAENEPIIILDKLTYAGSVNPLDTATHSHYHFEKGDINDQALVKRLFEQYKPRAILNFAAESHVDRSIHNPNHFIHTNINGTFCLLETARQYWLTLNTAEKTEFRFLQISTDEVYGSLKPHDAPFNESTAYAPNNPYSASKAAADHLVRSYHHTYGLPTFITNCSNNYGPYQFPEKLIPLTILNALENKPLPIYGDGLQIRDWLYVSDHCAAIKTVLANGKIGETYNIGAHNEKTNIDIVKTICEILDNIHPSPLQTSYTSLITHINDRPGHDRRYAIDAKKIEQELQWKPQVNFATGIQKTIQWYLNNLPWIEDIKSRDVYKQWLTTHYVQMEKS